MRKVIGIGGDRAAAAILFAAVIFWLWFSTRHDLVQDESYYWQWSRHLALGYYDGPPMVAFVIRFGTLLFGNTVLGVRCGAVFCAAIAAVFIYRLASEMFGQTVGFAALAAAIINPLFGAGATLMTLDPVQLCFWSICAWVSWRAVQANPASRSAWRLWLAAGFFAGVTAMSKFNGLLILPSVLVYTLIEPEARHWLRRPQPYVATAVALAVFAPFVWWNHAHGNAFWIHITAVGSRTSDPHAKITLKYLGEFLGAQLGLISPLLFLTYVVALFSLRRNATAGFRFCWSLTVVVFAATCLLALRSRVEANWAVAAYIGGFILVGYAVVDGARRSTALRVWHIASFVLAAALTVGIYYSTLTTGGTRIKFLDGRTNELYGWREMAVRVHADLSTMGPRAFVFGVNYRMPSELAFYLPGQPQTYSLFLHDRASEYMFWDDEPALIGRNALMVNDAETPDHLAAARAVFAKVTVEPPLHVYRAGDSEPIRTIQIFRCYDFKGYSRPAWQVGW